MDPLAVEPAPHILAGRDDRPAMHADHARGVRLVVVYLEAALVYVLLGVFLGVFLPRAAQILKQALLDLAASEIRRGCHVCLLRRDAITRS